MNIGCIALIPVQGGFVGLESPERGYILPGGKWEEGELFSQTCVREAREETGIIVKPKQLIFHSLCNDGFYVYAFKCKLLDDSAKMKIGPEGKVITVDWSMLALSKYAPYYELLREVYAKAA